MLTLTLRSVVNSLVAIGSLAAVTACFGAGCSTVSGESVCQQICDCQGCSKTETQACEADFATAEKLSGDEGCDDPYSAYVGCLADNSKCVDDKIDAIACAAEAQALTKCDKTGSIAVPGSSACQTYIAKAKTCCDALNNESARASCISSLDSIDISSLPEDACKAALDVTIC